MSASSGAIRAGRAFIELFAEDSALRRGLVAARAKLAAFGGGINALGASIGAGISTAFSAISKGAKLAGIGVAVVAGGLLAAAKSFADADRSMMSEDQASAADAMAASFQMLSESATALRNAIGTALQPAISAVVDIARIGMDVFRKWIATNGELIAGITDFIGGIRDALSAGDVQLAGEILWAGLKVVWTSGINSLMEQWVEWKTSFQQTASEAFLGLMNIAEVAWEEMKGMARSAGDFIANIWNGSVNKIAKGLTEAGEAVGFLTEGTSRTLDEDQNRAAKRTEAGRQERDRKIAAARRQAEDDFGETVNAANKQIAETNRKAIEEAQAAKDKAIADLNALTQRAKDNAKPIAADLAKKAEAVAAKISTNSVFGGTRLSVNSGDATGKKVEENTKKAADLLKSIDQKIIGGTPGIAVIAG